MRHIFLIVLCIYQIHAVKESDVDLTDLFSDPDLLLELQKRLGNLLGSDFSDENSEAAVASVGCFDLSGTIEHDCNFHSNESTIIKTTESLAKGAKFLKDYSNITCATDCTAQCCANPECDTVVFQNKYGCQMPRASEFCVQACDLHEFGCPRLARLDVQSEFDNCTKLHAWNYTIALIQDDHNCYLFKCDSPSLCVFAHHHLNYWMSSISKEVHTSHSYTPGGATVSHENELENLGSHDTVPETTLPPTTQKTTITKPKPGLGDFCESYDTECNDTHSECFRKTCRCNGGYHERNGICRKHCRTDEFECDQIVYGQGQRQCVHKSDMCDGTPDCNDSSDEYSCQDTDRTAYLDSTGNNQFNNPVYNSQYNNQADSQYPFGLPIPGLINQQQAGFIQPANQLYQGPIQANGNKVQIPANGNAGGQYYIPGLTNQVQGGVNIPKTGSQLNGQWPYLDSKAQVGSSIYQNNLPYQQPNSVQNVGHLQNYVPAQSGYVPVVQNPVQPVQQLNPNLQPVQQNLNPINVPVGQQTLPIQMPNPGVQQTNPGMKSLTANNPQTPILQGNKPNGPQNTQEKGQDQSEMNKQVYETATVVDELGKIDNILSDDLGNRYNDGLNSDSVNGGFYAHDKNKNTHALPTESDRKFNSPNGKDVTHLKKDNELDQDQDRSYEKTRTYPPATKAKQQIGTPTQSTVPGQKTGHSQTNSEGLPDYFSSWMHFEDDTPRVSGKKGKMLSPSQEHESEPENKLRTSKPYLESSKPLLSVTKPDTPKSNEDEASLNKYDDKVTKGRYDNDESGYKDRYQDRYDSRRPINSNNRRPSYDKYGDGYGDTKYKSSHGSRYPYYGSGYQHGRDRNPYPVWDPFRDEYDYPDDDFTDHRQPAGAGHDVDYDNYRTGDRGSKTRPYDDKDTEVEKSQPHTDSPAVTEPPRKIMASTEPHKDIAPPKEIEPDTRKPTTLMPTEAYKASDTDSDSKESQASTDTDQTDKGTDSNVKANREPVSSESTETQSTNNDDSKNSNDSSNISSGETQDSDFQILNVDSVKVESFTDSSQGPVVALALGLAITMMLLIFVGCRLRTVKRRLRKGRALHSNEADYLINGMYL